MGQVGGKIRKTSRLYLTSPCSELSGSQIYKKGVAIKALRHFLSPKADKNITILHFCVKKIYKSTKYIYNIHNIISKQGIFSVCRKILAVYRRGTKAVNVVLQRGYKSIFNCFQKR